MTTIRPSRTTAVVLIVAGSLGALAAFALLIEEIRVLEDPTYVPSCSINPVLSCGSVMLSGQAKAFGFPNPLLGLAAFPTVATLGVLLLAGARPPRWVWLGLQVGVTAGTAFVGWLMFQSLYRIDALCPYCLVVWVVMPPLLVQVTRYNITAGHLGFAVRRRCWSVAEQHVLWLTVWYLTVIGLILVRFWDYWKSLVR